MRRATEHTRDLIVLPNPVVSDWWRREGHSLAMEDLDEVLDELPERLVLGVGAPQLAASRPSGHRGARAAPRAGRVPAHRRGGAPLPRARRKLHRRRAAPDVLKPRGPLRQVAPPHRQRQRRPDRGGRARRGGAVVEPGLRSRRGLPARGLPARRPRRPGRAARRRSRARETGLRGPGRGAAPGAQLPEGGKALAVGHSPSNEAAVLGLTVVEPLGRGAGVLVVDERRSDAGRAPLR
jgi:hypothetical protein